MRFPVLHLLACFAFILLLLPTMARAQFASPGGACSGSGVLANSNGFLTCTGGVWVANPVSIGSQSASCGTGYAGQVQWTGSYMRGCDGTNWTNIIQHSNNAGSSTSIDWSQGNVQYTSASCGAMTFTNMLDGGTYQLFVEGTTSGTCSFSQSGLTFKLPSNFGATTASTMTVFSFTRAGSYVFVAWIPGY